MFLTGQFAHSMPATNNFSCDDVANFAYDKLNSQTYTENGKEIPNGPDRDVQIGDDFGLASERLNLLSEVIAKFWGDGPVNEQTPGWLHNLSNWMKSCSRTDYSNFQQLTDLAYKNHPYIDPSLHAQAIHFLTLSKIMNGFGQQTEHVSEVLQNQLAARQQAQQTKTNSEALGESGIPSCDSKALIQGVKGAVHNSPSGRAYGETLLGIENIKDVSVNSTRICVGVGYFSDGKQEVAYWTDNKYVQAKWGQDLQAADFMGLLSNPDTRLTTLENLR